MSTYKKIISLTLVLVMVFALTGCSSTSIDSKVQKDQKIKVVFWYSLGGKISVATKQLIDDFNKTHPNIEVEGIYQGSYDDSINKLKRAIQTKETPHIIQVYDIGSRFMIDSKAVVPVQKMIDAEKFDLSSYEPNILSYYTIDNTLYSMPFNTSTPLLFYNKNMFKEKGLNPDNPPRTFEDVTTVAKVLTTKDDAGKITRPGMTIAIYGWFFEQLMAVQNAMYADNNNGRDGHATKVVFNNEKGTKIISWWNDMIKDGSALNLGRGTANTQKAFASGQVAMTIDSSSVVADIMSGVNGKFEVGIGFLPRPQGSDGGIIIGGGSLWMLNGHGNNEEKAAWEFIKYVSSPEQQAKWHMNTGYFPTTKKAYDLPELKKHHEIFPQYKVAADQLHTTPITRATQGALLGVFTQARQEVEGAIENVINGQMPAKEALDKAAQIINDALDRYNKTK